MILKILEMQKKFNSYNILPFGKVSISDPFVRLKLNMDL